MLKHFEKLVQTLNTSSKDKDSIDTEDGPDILRSLVFETQIRNTIKSKDKVLIIDPLIQKRFEFVSADL